MTRPQVKNKMDWDTSMFNKLIVAFALALLLLVLTATVT